MRNAPPAFDPVRFLRIACRAASRVTRNHRVIEEAAELAVHRLQVAMVQGANLDHPEAWLCTVARRNALALARTNWAKAQTIPDEDIPIPEPIPFPWTRERLRCAIRSVLTPRQREALDAALSCRTTRDAARSCKMSPRDFRRYLTAICERARKRLDREPMREAVKPQEPSATTEAQQPSSG